MNSLTILIDHIQQLSVIASVNVSWPEGVAPIISGLRAARLDFANKIGNLSFSFSFRAQHLLLVNVLPLVLAIVLLALFQPLYVVLWYILLLIGLSAAIGGIVLVSLNSSVWGSQRGWSDWLLGGGFGLLGLLLAIFAYMKWRKWRRKKDFRARVGHSQDPETEQEPLQATQNGKTVELPLKTNAIKKSKQVSFGDDIEQAEVYDSEAALNVSRIKKGRKFPPKPWHAYVRYVILSSAFLYFGLLLADIPMPTPNWLSSGSQLFIVGYLLIICGIWLGLYFLISLSERGRRALYKTGHWVSANVGSIVLLLMTILYLPMATSIFAVFACAPITCPVNQEFSRNFNVKPGLDFVGLLESINYVSNSTTCSSCYFPSTCSIASQLCPGEIDIRLATDQSLSCSADIFPFYYPGAIPILFIIVIGLPILFFRLIKTATRLVGQIPQYKDSSATLNLIWTAQTLKSQNICRGLYFGYKYFWRHYTLVQLIHKMLVICIFIFAIYQPSMTLLIVAALHTFFFSVSLIGRPFLNGFENLLNTTCRFLNVANAVIAILVSYNFVFPPALFLALGLLNVILPVALLFYQIVWDVKRQKMLSDKLKEHDTFEDLQLITQIDDELNTYSVKRIVEYFLVLGVAAFLSLSITLVGIIYSNTSSNILTSSVPDQFNTNSTVTDFEFAGYTGWTQFTTNCCCEAKPYNSTAPVVQEVWKCLPNAYSNSNLGSKPYLYKIRTRKSGAESGFGIRDYCSTSFKCGTGPVYDSNLKKVVVQNCAGSTDYAASNLW